MHFTSASSLALVALATDARAHMILHSPVPYGNPTDNSPLKPAEFPCRMSNGFAITQMNTVAAGGSLPFSFMGTTVHTGGSCQFSVTTDVPPTTNSQWKVIHSAVGGCVSNYTNNFAPASPSALGDAHVYDIAFPKQLQSGQYSAAWTWINKAAEAPEFYMNCAPVTVTGGSSDASFLAGLPDMFVANLGSPAASCSTPSQGGDFVFPEPGDSVETESVTPLVPVSGVTGAGCATMTKLGAGAGSMGAPRLGQRQRQRQPRLVCVLRGRLAVGQRAVCERASPDHGGFLGRCVPGLQRRAVVGPGRERGDGGRGRVAVAVAVGRQRRAVPRERRRGLHWLQPVRPLQLWLGRRPEPRRRRALPQRHGAHRHARRPRPPCPPLPAPRPPPRLQPVLSACAACVCAGIQV